MIDRQTATKVHAKELSSGAWVEKEGMEPSFVATEAGKQVSRARILGTVVTKFVSEDGNFASATIDDSTETIRMKTFRTIKPLSGCEVGDTVDVIGKVRMYNDEVYIIPEIVRKVDDPNLELLRTLEILKLGQPGQQKAATAQKPATQQPAKPLVKQEYDREDIRKQVIAILNSNEKGIIFSEILKAVKAREEITESVVNDLLSEGMCYEPSPGKIRKI